MRTRIVRITLAGVMLIEIGSVAHAITTPCSNRLYDIWPLSMLFVLLIGFGGIAATWRTSTSAQIMVTLALVGALVAVDMLHARYRSQLGSLVFGGAEALVRHAHRAGDAQALGCLRAVGESTQYGPDVAQTYILRHYQPAEQARLFGLMARAVPQRARQLRPLAVDARERAQQAPHDQP